MLGNHEVELINNNKLVSKFVGSDQIIDSLTIHGNFGHLDYVCYKDRIISINMPTLTTYQLFRISEDGKLSYYKNIYWEGFFMPGLGLFFYKEDFSDLNACCVHVEDLSKKIGEIQIAPYKVSHEISNDSIIIWNGKKYIILKLSINSLTGQLEKEEHEFEFASHLGSNLHHFIAFPLSNKLFAICDKTNMLDKSRKQMVRIQIIIASSKDYKLIKKFKCNVKGYIRGNKDPMCYYDKEDSVFTIGHSHFHFDVDRLTFSKISNYQASTQGYVLPLSVNKALEAKQLIILSTPLPEVLVDIVFKYLNVNLSS